MSATPPSDLHATVAALLTAGKGILAADESFPTIGKRFAALNIPSNQENRRAYREALFTTAGLSEFISGAILFDETTTQRTKLGESLVGVLTSRNIVPGVKVDGGTVDLPNFHGEKFTSGLDGLPARLTAYRELGIRFTKWRAVFAIGDGLPTATCIETNARNLALFAAMSQEADMVPIVEPEVLMAGDHTLARCEDVTGIVLDAVFAALNDHLVNLEAMLLKTGMVLPGKTHPEPATVDEVAAATMRILHRAVPPAVPGIVFLSGGQSDLAATERLNAICASGPTPWTLSFSFGRALQNEAMKTWAGSPANADAAQQALNHRARCNSLAVQGHYLPAMEHPSLLKSM